MAHPCCVGLAVCSDGAVVGAKEGVPRVACMASQQSQMDQYNDGRTSAETGPV